MARRVIFETGPGVDGSMALFPCPGSPELRLDAVS